LNITGDDIDYEKAMVKLDSKNSKKKWPDIIKLKNHKMKIYEEVCYKDAYIRSFKFPSTSLYDIRVFFGLMHLVL
jgi:hypothetical protein